MHRPTLEDVAREAGVSRATVSRVVRNDTGVASDTVQRVQAAVAALGYVPNSAARTLASGAASTVAVVVPEPDARVFSDPFFGFTISGISHALSSTAFQLVMAFAPTEGFPTATTQFLLAGGVAGAIVVSHHRADGLATAIANLPLPSVFLGAPLVSEHLPGDVHTVDTDNRGGGILAAHRMIAQHIRRPASISGPLDMAASVERLEGWQETLRSIGLEPVHVEGDFTLDSGRECMEQLLDMHPNIDGVFIASDLMALGAVPVARRRGRIPGENLQVIAFDDFAGAKGQDLTAVRNPAVELGTEAAGMLLDLIDGKDPASPRILPTTLTIRSSG